MGQDGGHDRDELQQAIAEALQGTPVRAGEFLLDDRLVEVAEHAVPLLACALAPSVRRFLTTCAG